MAVYITGMLLSCLFAYLAAREGKKAAGVKSARLLKWAFSAMSFIPLFLISALRHGVGRDYFYTYAPGFLKIANGADYLTSSLHYEPGYFLLNKIVSAFTSDYIWIFVVTSFLYLAFVYSAIFRESDYPAASVFLLLGTTQYFFSMNCVRQALAISVVYWAFGYLKRGRVWMYWGMVAAAAMFHMSALLFLLLPLFLKVRITPAGCMIGLGAAFFARSFAGNFAHDLLAQTRYAYIFDRSGDYEFGIWWLLIQCAVLLFVLYMYPRGKDGKEYQLLLHMQLAAAFGTMIAGAVPSVVRIIYYGTFAQVLYLPKAIALERDCRVRLLMRMTIYGLFLIYMWYAIGVKGGPGVMPYRTIFGR